MPKALTDVKFPFFLAYKVHVLFIIIIIFYFLFNILFELNLHHTKRIHITT